MQHDPGEREFGQAEASPDLNGARAATASPAMTAAPTGSTPPPPTNTPIQGREAAANASGSLSLWREAGAAADILAGSGFRAVVEGFGRPRIETRRVCAAAFGSSTATRGPTETTRLVGPGDDLAARSANAPRRGRQA
ncbi:DUF4865 family protein [Methylobacterium sp. J-026]|uniref:DUF4865 family protein n=1 Tax=Methylobacterium sp. J-026 TaxID=2836624 RepID=UPI001FB9C785|nr:DUF4865 family protein [Methylobacterium sp. J-026]MCJ2133465.1 DUF4865 family protein [Methylobacterium sp. J-026]